MDKENKRTEWHPAFVNAMEIEFKDNAGDLVFTPEYNLTKKPLEVDLLVVRKTPGAVISNEIGKIFKEHNIFEYKSPDDEMNLDTFYKTIAYACLYKVEEKDRDTEGNIIHRQPEDITITMVRYRKPESLFSELTKRNIMIVPVAPGIYSVGKHIGFDIQIIVSKELSLEQHTWLQSLQRDIKYDNLDRVYKSWTLTADESLKNRMKEYLDFISSENSELSKRWKEEANMGGGLAMLMEPEIDAARKEGIEEGIEKGIEKGEKRGRDSSVNFTVKNLILRGFDIEDIKAISGATDDDIRKAKKEMHEL